MGSHLESYWLTDVNRLMSFFEFFVWIYYSTSQEMYFLFVDQVWKPLLSLTQYCSVYQVAVLKSIPRAWFTSSFAPKTSFGKVRNG